MFIKIGTRFVYYRKTVSDPGFFSSSIKLYIKILFSLKIIKKKLA